MIRAIMIGCAVAATGWSASLAGAENIDPLEDGSQYAYGENIGWVNFEPNQGAGVTVYGDRVTGLVWSGSVGWINLSPVGLAEGVGVSNDGTGLLSGLAWGENVGWVNFSPKVPGDANHHGVTIDEVGNFDGWAWGENIGWIHLRGRTDIEYKVQTSWLTDCQVWLDDLERFSQDWLETGQWPGDLDGNGWVDFKDYAVFADLWLGLCPPGWPLK